MFGRLASKIGSGISKVGMLASKIGTSSGLGQLANPLKTTLSIGGKLLDPLTMGMSGKVAGIVNKGIDFATNGGLANLGSKVSGIGSTIQNVGNAMSM